MKIPSTPVWKSGDSTFTDGTSTINWWNRCGPHCDGLHNEFYATTNNGSNQLRATGPAWYQNWTGWQRLIPTAQNMGNDFFGLTYGPNTAANMTYMKASFLLEWDGGGSAVGYGINGPANATDPTNAAWTTDIGTPTAAKTAVGVGWKRTYTGGTVMVNPSPTASQAFTSPSYTLGPTSALIV